MGKGCGRGLILGRDRWTSESETSQGREECYLRVKGVVVSTVLPNPGKVCGSRKKGREGEAGAIAG